MRGRVNWKQVRTLIAACAVGAVIVSVVPAAAAVGDAFVLGERNAANATTFLKGSTTRNLVITNTNADGVALDLVVEPGNPPMAVNSSGKVKLLNADKLDGKSSNSFLRKSQGPRAAYVAKNNLPDGNDAKPTTLLKVTIKAPGAGVLQISAAGDSGARYLDTWSQFSCWIAVDGKKLVGSEQWILVAAGSGDPWEAANWNENCVTVAAATVTKGTYTVNFRTNAHSTYTEFFAGTLSVLWVPFDGTGAVPMEFTNLTEADVGSAPATHGEEGPTLESLTR